MASNGSNPQMDNSTDVKSDPSQDDSSSGSTIVQIFTKAENKKKLLEFADNAADELHQMATSGSPLWYYDDLGVEHLFRQDYRSTFGPNNARRQELAIGILSRALDWPPEYPISSMMVDVPPPPLRSTASRAREIVLKNPVELVNMFMDVKQWLEMFSNIVSSTTLLGKILDDGNPDDSLIAIKAEFGLPSPLHTRRETYFLRRSRKVDDRIWLIVDASLDIPCLKCHKKPSGCLIEQLDDGSSRITWVEHNDLSKDNAYLNGIFRKYLSSGAAFRASRWLTTLKQRAENQLIIKQGINGQGTGRSSLMKMVHSMCQIWFSNMNSAKKTWNLIPNFTGNGAPVYVLKDYYENDNRGRRIDDSVMMVASSVWLPFTSNKLYDTLRCVDCSLKWDIAAYAKGYSRKELHIPMGNDQSTVDVSVLHVEVPGNQPLKRLQAIFTDSIGLYIIWTYLNQTTFNSMMNGNDDCDGAKLLVSGACVLRWAPRVLLESNQGSILTVSFEMLTEGSGVLCIDLVETFNAIMNHTLSSVNALCTQIHEDQEG